jgi:hypothetical protein
MKLSSFTATADLTLNMSEYVTPGEDATLHVTADRNAITPALQTAINEDENNLALLVEAILALVKKWDLIGEKGKPIPLTSEAVSQIGAFFLFALFVKISDAFESEAEEEGKASAAAS